MRRRQFLERSGTAVLAITGLPLLMRRDQTTPAIYLGEKTDANKVRWTYEMKLVIDSINRFTAASDQNKKVTLKITQPPVAGSSATASIKTGEYSYQLSNVILLESSPKQADMKAKFTARTSGDLDLPAELPKDLNCVIRPYMDVVVRDTKGKEYVKLNYQSYSSSSSDDDGDCFLTTACVHHKGLADNCHELQTIRFLRENYMRGTGSGEILLQEYGEVGPAILRSLKEAENRKEILDHLYNYLVIPSVEKIEKGQYHEAVAYYAGYVEAMKENYL